MGFHFLSFLFSFQKIISTREVASEMSNVRKDNDTL